MAIINRPPTEAKTAPPEEVTGIISRPRTKVEEHNITGDNGLNALPKQGTPFPRWLTWTLLSLLAIGLITAVLSLLPSFNFGNKATTDNITLDVDRLIRIDSVIALLEQRIEHNQVTLQRSEKSGDKVLIDTIRLALAKNLIDLENHQNSYIHVLESLQHAYSANSKKVVSTLREHLKSSTDSYKTGRVSAINEALDLIASVPDDQSPTEYFTVKVKTHN